MPRAAGVAPARKHKLVEFHLLKEQRSKDRFLSVVTKCGLEGHPYDGVRGIRTTAWASEVTCGACAALPGVTGHA